MSLDLAAVLAARDTRQARPEAPVVVPGGVRDDLPGLLAARGAATGAEVGVNHGAHAEGLCRGVPGLKLICVDRWQPYRLDDRTWAYRRGDRNYAAAAARLAPYDCRLMRLASVDAARLVPDASLDFVYLDADHRAPAVLADLEAWTPKVKAGGLVAGHDYEEAPNIHNAVCVVIREWTRAHGIAPWFVLGRARARRGEATEKHRTWLWEVR